MAVEYASGSRSPPDLARRRPLTVEGTPVTIAYCVSGKTRIERLRGDRRPVSATYSGPGGHVAPFDRTAFIAGEGVSRVIESLDLTKLALTGTLHLTLAYSSGLVRARRRPPDARRDHDQVKSRASATLRVSCRTLGCVCDGATSPYNRSKIPDGCR